ncbi:unnamed protein product [Clonostachys rosea f. rosea IK726]|uniref:Uncharacterized protein n=1 Tax=Clonostachys rosea f. rosea IK726 TaxID=1349383 RepID=A0ACA9U756_BIOOC|nr:unnamed protein product [Clonostachys rosea f. rosea IK726]
MASPIDTEMTSCTCHRKKAFVGIDMGATHAGISCITYVDCQACGKKHDKVRHHTLVNKFPVLLAYAYDSSRPTFRFIETKGKLYNHETALSNFKLLLPKMDSYQNQCHTEAIIQYINKTTLDVATNHGHGIVVEMVKKYLDGLINLMLEKMAETAPGILKKDMKIILTYPEFFQSSTGEAFTLLSQAIDLLDMQGILSIDKLPEHSAALKASLYFARGDLWKHQMANAWVVVADCGGMTVDAVLYRIPAPNTTEDTTQFHQLSSSLVGGVWVDQAIDMYARQHLRTWPGGHDNGLFETRVQQVMDHWHRVIKPEFEPDDRLPALALGNGLFFDYPRDVIIKAFKDVIEIIYNAVSELWHARGLNGMHPKGLILSGGLAQQEYLKDQLLVKLRQKIDQNLEIIPEIPQDSWNWVASGAALSGLSSTSLFNHSTEYAGLAN